MRNSVLKSKLGLAQHKVSTRLLGHAHFRHPSPRTDFKPTPLPNSVLQNPLPHSSEGGSGLSHVPRYLQWGPRWLSSLLCQRLEHRRGFEKWARTFCCQLSSGGRWGSPSCTPGPSSQSTPAPPGRARAPKEEQSHFSHPKNTAGTVSAQTQKQAKSRLA